MQALWSLLRLSALKACTHKLDLYLNKNTEALHENKGIRVYRFIWPNTQHEYAKSRWCLFGIMEVEETVYICLSSFKRHLSWSIYSVSVKLEKARSLWILLWLVQESKPTPILPHITKYNHLWSHTIWSPLVSLSVFHFSLSAHLSAWLVSWAAG